MFNLRRGQSDIAVIIYRRHSFQLANNLNKAVVHPAVYCRKERAMQVPTKTIKISKIISTDSPLSSKKLNLWDFLTD
jgi:hypothetical protein